MCLHSRATVMAQASIVRPSIHKLRFLGNYSMDPDQILWEATYPLDLQTVFFFLFFFFSKFSILKFLWFFFVFVNMGPYGSKKFQNVAPPVLFFRNNHRNKSKRTRKRIAATRNLHQAITEPSPGNHGPCPGNHGTKSREPETKSRQPGTKSRTPWDWIQETRNRIVQPETFTRQAWNRRNKVQGSMKWI